MFKQRYLKKFPHRLNVGHPLPYLHLTARLWVQQQICCDVGPSEPMYRMSTKHGWTSPCLNQIGFRMYPTHIAPEADFVVTA